MENSYLNWRKYRNKPYHYKTTEFFGKKFRETVNSAGNRFEVSGKLFLCFGAVV